jgi:Cd2+/Zn2+-exporting ATPase
VLKQYALNEKIKIIRLFTGAAVFAAGMAFEKTVRDAGFAPFVFFLTGFLITGADIVLSALKNIFRGKIFDENFLMSIAAIGAFATGESAEAVAVMLFYQAGEFFQERAVKKSKSSITELMGIRPDSASLKKGEVIVKVAPETVCIGNVIIIKPGERIPLDGIVIEGSSLLDTSALTGESIPRKVEASDTVFSGCVNQTGLLSVQVTKTFGESTVSKIIGLAENAAAKKAKTEKFITAFARYYTPIVVTLAALLAVLPPLFFGGIYREWINRALVFLVISCPCALVLSIPMGFSAGIGRAAKIGVLVKGGNYLEALNQLDTVVFDKTGTLTRGVFKVTAVYPAKEFSSTLTPDALLEMAAYAEAFSNHPIALSIMQKYGKEINLNDLFEYTEFSGYGVSVKRHSQTILAGSEKFMSKMKIIFEESHNSGTKVYVAVDKVFAGCIVISDEIKPDSLRAVSGLKKRGVRKIVMLTGDDPHIAETVANELGLDEMYGGLLPHEKVEKVEIFNNEKRANGKLAFIGDGINDAPVLAIADIGIAMGGLGSDAAIEAADVVLMTDEPSKLAETMDIARFTRKTVWQNIIFALGVKAVFLLLGAIGFASMWEAVFADVGVSVLAVLNAMRILTKKV